MEYNYTFQGAMSIGREAEVKVMRWLNSQRSVNKVEDVTAVREYQKMDVDLLIHGNKGVHKGEVKGDTNYNKGNVFYETLRNVNKGTNGCLEVSDADFLFYCFLRKDAKYDVIYMIPFKEFRAWVHEHKSEFREVQTKGTKVGNVGHYRSQGLLIPRERIEKEVPGTNVINLMR